MDRRLSDETYLKIMFRAQLGETLDFENPVTFNAKLQWLKLHDRNPLYTTLVDKYRVKPWVANRIGAEHVTKNYGVWASVEDIDLDDLPGRFVLKTNHDSGGVAICRDRETFDFDAAKRILQRSFENNYYWSCREWPYKDVKPLVFAEEYLETGLLSNELTDYKVMCFDGTAKCVFSYTDRAKDDLRVDFFDLDWNHLPFTRHYPNADCLPEKPSTLHEMIAMAERLVEGTTFVRCDFYEVGGRAYFGEMTFYPGSGYEEFDPDCWDEKLGSLVMLPKTVREGGWLIMNAESMIWMHMEKGQTSADRAGTEEQDGLIDYKFYCFSGVPKFLYVSKGLIDHATAQMSFLNLDWTSAPFRRHDYLPFKELPFKPACFEDMLGIASKLSSGIPFVRVDLFEYEGQVRFSEMTFSPCGGFMEFDPPEWDRRIGELIDLEFM